MNFFRIFEVIMRERKIVEIFNKVMRCRFNDLGTLSKISTIFLSRIMTPKILKKFMVIYGS